MNSLPAKSCTNPKEYEAWEIEAFADGEEMPHVEKHLEQCGHCEEKLIQMRYIDAGLTQTLYRFDCHPFESLRRHYWQELSDQDSRKIQLHLAICPLCTDEFAEIRQLSSLNAAPVAAAQPSILDKISEKIDGYIQGIDFLVATLISGPQQSTAGASFRGKSEHQSLLYQVDDLMVSLLLKGEGADTKTISGQVLADTIAGNATFQLIPDSDKVSVIGGEIDATGLFTVDDLENGVYHLLLKFNAQALLIPDIAILPS